MILEVEEVIDGSSFIVKSDAAGVDSIKVTGVFPDNSGVEGSYTLQPTDSLANGFSLTAQSLGFGNTFKDGIYTIELLDSSNNVIVSATEGFVAIVAVAVMKDALNYRVEQSNVDKYKVQEEMRLLDNISYSAELGLQDAFMENLSTLQKLV